MGILSSKRGMAMRYGTYLAVFAATGYAFGQNGSYAAPCDRQRSLPNSTSCAAKNTLQTMQRLRVVRQYESAMFVLTRRYAWRDEAGLWSDAQHPKASFNIAQRLRAMPQNVEVREDESDISEIDQGLVIHHVMTFRVLPGKCADSGAKAQIAQAGIGCFTKESTNSTWRNLPCPATYAMSQIRPNAKSHCRL